MCDFKQHEKYMAMAIEEAKKAADIDEVPVGAIIIKEGAVVGRGFNRIETEQDPTCHAEIIAIKEATSFLNSKRLIGCTMYVTTEPCSMCAGASVLARLDAIVAGASSDKSGACGSVKNILESDSLNHRVEYTVGVLGKECSEILSSFFRELRARSEGKKEVLEEMN